MSNLYRMLSNKLWRLINPKPTPFRDFAISFEKAESLRDSGRCAQIFFDNKSEGVFKWLHYLSIYDKVFERFVGMPVRFLEIGVFRGGSLNLWREYFGKEAIIFGIDIDPNCANFDGISGQVRIGSQADSRFLQRVVEEMGGVDIVLDDGSHIAHHQRASFDALFPLLSNGGIYMVEDTHTAYWPSHEGGLRRKGTAIEFFKDMIDDMHKHYFCLGTNTSKKMIPIESIQFFDSIIVVQKRTQVPRGHLIVPKEA